MEEDENEWPPIVVNNLVQKSYKEDPDAAVLGNIQIFRLKFQTYYNFGENEEFSMVKNEKYSYVNFV